MCVLIVDAQPLFVEVLTAIAQASFRSATVAAAADLAGALESARAGAKPDLVLLDPQLPGCTGLAALAQCRAALQARVVVVSAAETRGVARAALEAGAAGYIPKSSPPSVMLAALRLVAAGGTYAPPECMAQRPDESKSRPLTERQREVLGLIARGLANKEIARHLRITQDTVKQHARAVYMALGVAGRWQAARVAESLGILELD